MLIDRIISREGMTTWMYLDTVRVVTVGVGHAMFSVDDCLKLEWNHPEAQVRADYMKVRATVTGYKASFYEPLTVSRLSEGLVRELLERDIAEHVSAMKKYFPDFDSYPQPAQDAMTDLCFNCGPNLPAKFPKLTAAIRNQKWALAASLCHRKGIAESRNEETKSLFLAAVVPQQQADKSEPQDQG